MERDASLADNSLSRDVLQPPIGIITAACSILNSRWRLNCNSLSHPSLKRFGHFPGMELRLCQQNSSVHSHPCSRSAKINFMTYVSRSPAVTCSLILRMNVPVGLRTRSSSAEIGINQSTYSLALIPT